jgi:hypothetical protein
MFYTTNIDNGKMFRLIDLASIHMMSNDPTNKEDLRSTIIPQKWLPIIVVSQDMVTWINNKGGFSL